VVAAAPDHAGEEVQVIDDHAVVLAQGVHDQLLERLLQRQRVAGAQGIDVVLGGQEGAAVDALASRSSVVLPVPRPPWRATTGPTVRASRSLAKACFWAGVSGCVISGVPRAGSRARHLPDSEG